LSLKHPPGVAVSLPIAPVIKAKTQGKNIRQNCHHQDARAQSMAMFQGNKAKHQNCTIVHLLTNDELNTMKDKGTIVIHITLPIKSNNTTEKSTFWLIVDVLGNIDVFSSPCKNDMLIVTSYDQLQSSKQICFIGREFNKPTPKTWALLCLVHQQTDFKSSFDTNSYVVHDSKSDCKRAKHNIVTGRATGHHRSCGNIHGFGSCRDMHINNKTLSSLSKYVVKKGGIEINGVLKDCLKKSMESVRDELRRFLGYDILLNNCNSLSVSEKYACKFGISQAFHLLGCTGYMSLFYNIDASTLDRHTEMD